MKTKNGFTLVEVMIVTAIIGLLAAILIPAFNKAKERSLQQSGSNVRDVIKPNSETTSLAPIDTPVHYVSTQTESIKITCIDSCQYLTFKNSLNDTIYSHKGNCTNSIHRYNQF